MIPTNIKTDVISQPPRVGPVRPITPVTAITDLPQSAPDFTPGQKYQATVGTKLPNGNAQVSIAGQLLQMQLPGNFKPGNQLELVFITQNPQLKFLLQNSPNANAGNTPAAISTAGRLIGLLAQQHSQPSTQLVTDSNPILADLTKNNVEIPALLQKAITQSGLFYESHLTQWLTGKRTLTQLQQEPQNKVATAKTANLVSSNAELPVNTQNLVFVQQQLATLESGHLIWRGEIWPGQQLEWTIIEHESSGNRQEKDNSPSSPWLTKLHLKLPNLGNVTATIMLDSNKVFIKFTAETTKAAELLEENKSPLASALAVAGMRLQTIEIDANDNE